MLLWLQNQGRRYLGMEYDYVIEKMHIKFLSEILTGRDYIEHVVLGGMTIF